MTIFPDRWPQLPALPQTGKRVRELHPIRIVNITTLYPAFPELFRILHNKFLSMAPQFSSVKSGIFRRIGFDLPYGRCYNKVQFIDNSGKGGLAVVSTSRADRAAAGRSGLCDL